MIDPMEAIKARKAKILADAEREAAALDADVREIERLQNIADKYGLTLTEKPKEPAAGAVSAPTEKRDPTYKAAISACENAIKAANSPLEVNQLFDACMSLGVHLGGKRPQSTLCAYLAHETSTVRPIKRG